MSDISLPVYNGLAPISLTLTAADYGSRLDKVLAALMPEHSRNRLQQWIKLGYITVNGAPARASMTMTGKEVIAIMPTPTPQAYAFQPEPIAVPVVYEDHSILIVDKPAGLVVHPAAGNWSGTLLNGLLYHWPALDSIPRAGLVHRLDKDTSGLMVVAKTCIAQTELARQLQARTIKRHYLALVWGTPRPSGTINAALARHTRNRIKMAVSESSTAKPAVTHYWRLAQGVLDGQAVSLMLCQLESGRTHQIRVHMQSIHFALVGDPVYGKTHLEGKMMHVFSRQALLAWRLELMHPDNSQLYIWTANLPEDFAALLAHAGINLQLETLVSELKKE